MDPLIQVTVYQAKGDVKRTMIECGQLPVGEEYFAVVVTDINAKQRRNFEFTVPKGEHFQKGLEEAFQKVMVLAAERITKGRYLVSSRPVIEPEAESENAS